MISIRKFGALAALALIPSAPVLALDGGEVFGDWTVVCAGTQEDPDANVCQIIQDIRVQQENADAPQTIMRVRIGYDEEQQIAAAMFQMPLGLLLTQGMLLQVDETDALRIPIQTCTQQGCRTVVPLDATQQSLFRSGTQLKIGLVSYRGQPIAMGVSLIGFGAGLDALIAELGN
jgi:invasion protein IalB